VSRHLNRGIKRHEVSPRVRHLAVCIGHAPGLLHSGAGRALGGHRRKTSRARAWWFLPSGAWA